MAASRMHNRVIRLNKNTQLCVDPCVEFLVNTHMCKYKQYVKEKSPTENMEVLLNNRTTERPPPRNISVNSNSACVNSNSIIV